MTAVLSAERISFSVGKLPLVSDVSFALQSGELLAVVGPNGAGKSTLLRLLAGDLRPTDGRVFVEGRELADYRPKALARVRSVLPQRTTIEFAFTVGDVVAMGRSPYAGSHDDEAPIIERAMDCAGIGHLRTRTYPSLSGGEQARVCFARVLAQETPLILLDEPTAALDIRYQHTILGESAKLVAQGHTVVAVLHDLNLAAAYANLVMLMSRGRIVALGNPHEVLTSALVSEVYEHPITVRRDESGRIHCLAEPRL